VGRRQKVKERGEKREERGRRWGGGEEKAPACLFCVLITDVGKLLLRMRKQAACSKAISRLCSPARGEARDWQGLGTALPWSQRVGRDKERRITVTRRGHFRGIFHLGRPQTLSLEKYLNGHLSLFLLSWGLNQPYPGTCNAA
jgi:hypothetical protein